MQNVLIHIDHDLGPIGIWAFHHNPSRLTHFYPESLDLTISGRARQLMAERPLLTDTPDWFTYLSTLHPGLDTYETVDVADELAMIDVLTEYRRVWNTTV